MYVHARKIFFGFICICEIFFVPLCPILKTMFQTITNNNKLFKQLISNMNRKFLSVALCLMATLTMTAQDVDKALVTDKAAAAEKAAGDLKKLEDGEKAWKFDGTVGLNAAATGLVNWAAGGKNNVNGIAYAKLHLLYHKDAIAWETNFDTDFGLTWIDQKEDAFQKSSDNIKLATKFGWEFKKNWYLTVLGGFQSQYALGRNYVEGYNNIISKWLAPSYTDISVGIDYKYSYNGADFSVYLSPIAGRISTAYTGDAWNKRYTKEAYIGALDNQLKAGDITLAEYDAAVAAYDFDKMVENKADLRSTLQQTVGTYTYDKEGNQLYRNFRAEFGLSFKGAIAYTYKDFKLSTTLALFTPYQGRGFNVRDAWLAADNTRKAEDWNGYFLYSNNNRQFGNFDVDWDVALSYQFLKCLQVTLQTSLKYYNGTLIANKDGVEAERVQFKGVIGIGVGYSF
jgi:hypothetical protein